MRDLDFLESPLLKAAEALKQKKAHVQEWKHILKRLPGVKQVEIDWLGLHDWLDSHPKSQKAKPEAITKEELVTFIRANQVKLQVFVRGPKLNHEIENPYPMRPTWEDAGREEAIKCLIDQDKRWLEPDYQIRDEEDPVYPDDFNEEAEHHLEEAALELRRDLRDGEPEPSDEDIFFRAMDIAKQRYKPQEYEVVLRPMGDDWPKYSGYYNEAFNTYCFPGLPSNGIPRPEERVQSGANEGGVTDRSDNELQQFEQSPHVGYEKARKLAQRVFEVARDKAISDLLAEWKEKPRNKNLQTRSEFAETLWQWRREVREVKLKNQEVARQNLLADKKNNELGVHGNPLHPSYTEPGGDDYHEFEIIFPNLHLEGKNKNEDPEAHTLERMRKELRDHKKVSRSKYPGGEEAWIARHKELRMAAKRQEENVARVLKEPFVEEAHFVEENIVVHVRATVRKGPNGENILFAEEFQSDLATKWREDTEPAEVAAKRRRLEEEERRLKGHFRGALEDVIDAIKAQSKEFPEVLWDKKSSSVLRDFDLDKYGHAWVSENVSEVLNGLLTRSLFTSPEKRAKWIAEGHKNPTTYSALLSLLVKSDEAVAAARRYEEMKNLVGEKSAELHLMGTEKKASPTLPDTPFKEEHSYNLAVKFLLRWAAERGFDGVAWTPAWMQAERWGDGAKSVVYGAAWKTIEEDDGKKAVPPSKLLRLKTSQGASIDMTLGNDGTVIHSDRENHRFSEKHISHLLPAKIADRVLNENSGSWSEQKLTMQDSGYVVAYDIQVRKAMDRFVRKFGARVDAMRGIGGLKQGLDFSRENILAKPVEDVEAGLIGAGLLTPDEAERRRERARLVFKISPDDILEDLEKNFLIENMESDELSRAFPKSFQQDPIWYVGMTPQLKKACLEPMPMFRMPGIDQKGHLPQNALDRITGELEGRLKKLGLDDVTLLADASFSQQGAVISQGFDEFTVLIGRTLDPHQTLDHEAVHILRRRGLFTAEEWQALSQAAEDEWIDDYGIEARYGSAPRSVQIEEAIAEAFADHAAKLRNQPIIKRAFNKVRAFFRELSRSLGACGISNVEQIFDAADAGIVGRRKDMGTERAFSMNSTPLAAGPGI